ncbi:TNF receptor-associated factor 4-like isoform X2 [Actinia tenebrosa]|uniref:TNF receptor-associated factor 4-like isoform X2 n=1 Tax=Actinia tenebrosa TaxID=6105 RepID=A0A6P8H1A6_ACTTE|nr:TNF receptor-associated factor 4-like isoform X2 [Actinia tenebrosa]XP_031549453.1 TNF receptor-associated factor 4-like isoform X2 [Actinia tenebrosa]
MVDIDSNVNAEKQDSCRNTPKSEHENTMTGGAPSPTGSTRSRSSQAEHYPTKNDLLFPAQAKYICPKCNELLRYAVQIKPCGHRVCYPCYKELLLSSEKRCPTDNLQMEPVPAEDDTAFNDEVKALEVRCKYYGDWGCKWEGPVEEFQQHWKEICSYGERMCVNDCGAKFQRRFEKKHMEKDCPKEIVTCPYCDDRHLREDKKEHLQECPKLPLPCPNKCDKKLTLPRNELDHHIDVDCPRTKLKCEFEALGCEHRCSREKMAKHNKSEIINHVKIVYKMMMENKMMLDSHQLKLEEHEKVMKSQEQRIGDLEKIAHSQLIWRIEDYSRKFKEAKAGNNSTLFSPTFTTSKHGYRLCASVCLNGDGKGKGTHMSVFVSVLKGAFDALLKWPFDYRVTFTLLDQAEEVSQRKHIKFSIKPNPCPDNEPFLGKPKMEKNASFGGAKFAKHEEIESRNYIKDDTVFLKINVDCDGLSEP